MNKYVVMAGIFLVIVLGAGIWYNNHQTSTRPTSQSTHSESQMHEHESRENETIAEEATESEEVMPSQETETMQTSVQEFTVEAGNFSFTPNEIAVKQGDTVKITFKNNEGMHDWVLDEFNVRTKVISGGKTETVEFVADKTGSFEFYCSVGNHRALGMVGTLSVE